MIGEWILTLFLLYLLLPKPVPSAIAQLFKIPELLDDDPEQDDPNSGPNSLLSQYLALDSPVNRRLQSIERL